MEKVITISKKNYQMKASAITQFSYKNLTGRSFLKDLQDLTKLKKTKNNSFEIEQLNIVTEVILKIAYTLIKESDKLHNSTQVTDYESFLSEIDSLYDDSNWINEVIELACTPISGRL